MTVEGGLCYSWSFGPAPLSHSEQGRIIYNKAVVFIKAERHIFACLNYLQGHPWDGCGGSADALKLQRAGRGAQRQYAVKLRQILSLFCSPKEERYYILSGFCKSYFLSILGAIYW